MNAGDYDFPLGLVGIILLLCVMLWAWDASADCYQWDKETRVCQI